MLRVTNASDGDIVPRMYSYWSNAVTLDGFTYVFCGRSDGLPLFFKANLETGAVMRLPVALPYRGTTEGWYWDAAGWLYIIDGPRFRHVNPFTGEDQIVFDITGTHPGCDLWQAHSSDDGRVHSATVRQIVSEGAYPAIGTVVCINGAQTFYPAGAKLDESIITTDGRYLLIQENNDLIVMDLVTGEMRSVADADGALAHIDCGPSYAVGEADKPDPQSCVFMDLRKPLTLNNRIELFHTSNMGHVSVKQGRCIVSDTEHISLVALNGSGVTPLIAHGMVIPPGTPEWEKYDFQVKANLDPSGRLATYMTNNGTDRQDVYLLVL